MLISFDEYLEHPELGGFSLPDLSTWEYQLTAYRAFDGMPPRDGDLERLTELTGRTEWPTTPMKELHNNWCRRSGKSRLNSHRAVWHAIDDSHLDDLAPGERCQIKITCPSKRQAKESFGFIEGIFEAPALAALIDGDFTADGVSLTNRIDIVVQVASYRTSRGGSAKAWFFDEANFLYIDGANALPELLSAAAPSLATIKHSRKYLTSSVYSQFGEMPDAKRRYWGINDAPVLVTNGDWSILRPDLKETVEAEMKRDPERARAEWYSEERTELASAFLTDWVDDAMSLRNKPIPRSHHENWYYQAFYDGSGGAHDAAALAIAIVIPDKEYATLVFHRRWPAPHSPAEVIKEAAKYLKEYGCSLVTGDAYAAKFMDDAFSEVGIQYKRSELNRSQIYLEAIPLFATGKVEIHEDERLRRELISLHRKTISGGRDKVDHPPGGSDDLANAVCGALVNAWRSRSGGDFDFIVIPGAAEQINAELEDIAYGSGPSYGAAMKYD